ncbi:MAG: molybdopterin-dependent oxidoreductase [Armatimonadetes bacterium]|nr:molybdopterin-dependent oxidoreductase [Armatimonadota bacterium]
MAVGRLGRSVVCPFCGCGCRMHVVEWGRGLYSVVGNQSHRDSNGRLCYRGWQVGDLLGNPLHLVSPLVRQDGELLASTYDEAIARACDGLSAARQRGAPIWVLGGSALTCEEAFVTRLFAERVLGTPHRDCLARVLDDAAVWHLQYVLCEPYRVPPLERIGNSDAVLAFSSGLHTENPQAYAWAMSARSSGAALMVIDEVDMGMGGVADVFLLCRPGAVAAAIAALDQMLSGDESVPEGLGAVADVSALAQAAEVLRKSRRPALIASSAGLPRPEVAARIADIASWLWADESKDVALYLLRSECNTRGASLVGLRPVGRSALDVHWLVDEGELGALVVVEEDLGRWVGADTLARIRERLGFVVALASLPSPTTEIADAVLPIASTGERAGTVMSEDGSLWWMDAVTTAPGEARPATAVLADIAGRLGEAIPGINWEEIWHEMQRTVMECSRIDIGQLQEQGQAQVHAGLLEQPTGSLPALERPVEPAGKADGRDFILIARRDENAWAFDPKVRAAAILERDYRRARKPYVYMNPADIQGIGSRPGRTARVETVHGAAEVELRSSKGIPAGVVVLPEHFATTRRQLLGPGEPSEAGGRVWHPVWAAIAAL